jgi:hypothetical protein
MELSIALSILTESRNGLVTYESNEIEQARQVLQLECPEWHWQQDDDGSWSIHQPSLQDMGD